MAFQRKGNPRRCLWTAIYRRLHHKGSANKEMKKKKARKTKRVERAIAGTTLDELKKKRTETPEERAAARKAAKENKAKVNQLICVLFSLSNTFVWITVGCFFDLFLD